MFTIDLLKGQGIPIRSQPQGIVLGVIIIVVPLIMTVISLNSYLNSRVTIGVQAREIAVSGPQFSSTLSKTYLTRLF